MSLDYIFQRAYTPKKKKKKQTIFLSKFNFLGFQWAHVKKIDLDALDYWIEKYVLTSDKIDGIRIKLQVL